MEKKRMEWTKGGLEDKYERGKGKGQNKLKVGRRMNIKVGKERKGWIKCEKYKGENDKDEILNQRGKGEWIWKSKMKGKEGIKGGKNDEYESNEVNGKNESIW